jgi:hypothetical protein
MGFQVPSQQINLTAKATPPTAQVGKQATWQYDLQLLPTPQGQAGTLQVTTSSAQWLTYSQNTSKAYFFGDRYTRLPDSFQANAELTLQQNAGKATLSASLGSFQLDPAGSDLMLPQSLSFNGSVPGLSWYLNGMMPMTTAMKLQGTLTVQGNQRSDSYMAEVTCANGDLTIRLLNDEKAIDINLYLQGGKLKGQARSRVDRRYQLADITSSKEGKVMITYGDGSQEALF